MAQKEFSIIWNFAAKIGNNLLGAFRKMSGGMSDAAKSAEKYSSALDDLSLAGGKNASVMMRMTGAVSKYLEKMPMLKKMMNTPMGKGASIALGGKFFQMGGERLYNSSMNAARGMYEASRGAMEFESAMADVRKVVDFDSKEQFEGMSKAILELSMRIPMAQTGLAQIVAAGGQSGIARDELISFAESAAKMGVAFDISADQAGEMMAKWRTAFKMNQDQVVALADQINYLGNNTAASAPKISEVVTRIGPLGEVGGVASNEIAALSASMVGAGVESEVAATGIKNMILALVSGESATQKQREAFAEIGLTAEDVATGMQENAQATILNIMERIKDVDKVRQASLMQDLFNKESLAPITTLLTNLDNVKKNFNLVASAESYAGSMEAEYAERSKTTENAIQLMNNQFDALKITIMTSLLPVIQSVAKLMSGVAKWFQEFANKHPQLITFLTTGTALLVGLGVVLGGLVVIIAPIVSAVGALAAAFGVAATTVLAVGGAAIAVIAAVGALAAAIYIYWDEICDTVSNEVEYIGKVIDNGLNGAWNAIMDFCQNIRKDFAGVFDWISGKWEWLSNILSQPITAVFSGTTDGAAVASNAAGGIYGRGAFLTTFAEDSGESAIPHTPTARNIGLLA
ncbi:MAG: phage tail tape measure protein, partial [Schwartzia sp.]|nr:phage tail tape measure protein [Schwartzia sp. (in: firmicutes)]